MMERFEKEMKKFRKAEKVKTICGCALCLIIALIFFIVTSQLELYRWNNGNCRVCHTKYTYTGYHFEGKHHNIKKYDYSCNCPIDFSTSVRLDK